MARQSKFQKFEMDTIRRDAIHGAEYNPRIISEDARKRLRKMLASTALSSRLSGTSAQETLFPATSVSRPLILLSVHRITICRWLSLMWMRGKSAF